MSAILVFDMDGVLVDVSESYRETIVQTVEHFTGQRVTRELVQEYKNRGGFNDDFLLSQAIAADLGVSVDFQTVMEYFNQIFYGGLMQRERWLPRTGLLDQLAAERRLAIFTGRCHEEALITLRRFAVVPFFDPLIASDHVSQGKPHPEGLLKIRSQHPGATLLYVGDTVDDARSARAAGVPFIGVAARDAFYRERVLELFEQEKAMAVVEDVNQLPEVLPK